MKIRNRIELKQDALRALTRGRDPKKTVTAYAGATVLIAAALTLINFWLSKQISTTGGLSNMGTRSILSTAQAILPMVQMVLLLCLEYGYLYAMMRIARGQYADHTDLKVGFQRFWPLLRMNLLQGLLYFAVGIATFYFSMQVFLMTPWSEPLIELLMPFVESGNPVMDDATVLAAGSAMIPLLILYLLVYLAVIIPVSYWFRMAGFSLLDNPGAGALVALSASRRMMRRNSLNLFKLDVSFWWYYLLQGLVMVVCYGDVLLPMMGITLPFNATVSYFLFYGLYLCGLFVTTYFLRNHVETTYIMAYESICEKPKDNGVVLGNIFDM